MSHRTHRERSRQRLSPTRHPIRISRTTKHILEQTKRSHDRGTQPTRGSSLTHPPIRRTICMAILPTPKTHPFNRLHNRPHTPHAKIPPAHQTTKPIRNSIQNNKSMGNHTRPRLSNTRLLQHHFRIIRKPIKQLHEPRRRILHNISRRRQLQSTLRLVQLPTRRTLYSQPGI